MVKVLLIDDDPDYLHLLADYLRLKGHEVFTAANGLLAFDELEQHHADVIISDVLMQDTPILSFTCAIKRFYPGTPLILISGLPQGQLVNNSLSLGADEFIPKPLDLSFFLKRVEQLGARA